MSYIWLKNRFVVVFSGLALQMYSKFKSFKYEIKFLVLFRLSRLKLNLSLSF